VGPEEIAIYVALALVAAGMWQVWRPGACLVPGAVMLWMYLPQRAAFVERRPAVVQQKSRRNE
jgi:uncharacterized membrane protein YecN with MAPEG domain